MRNMKSSLNGKVVTFDFDHTIVKSFLNKRVDGEEHYQFGGINKEIIKRIKKFKESGTTVMVVTSRNNALEDDESSVKSILQRLNLEVDAVFYTNEEPKARKLYELGSCLHYDDDPEEHNAINAFKKLHKDFNIEVKYPDDLIKDTNDISKGIVLTSDYKIIIAQRSDSHEWDAPGGHIMEGEEAPYAFWREIKEELGINVEEVQYLDTLEIEWKGKEKLAHYFFGRIDYSSEELEGIINLQWEVSDYFCGNYDEIMQEIGDNATQNLVNVMKMLEMQQELIESFNPCEKGSKLTKRTIFGLEKLIERDFQKDSEPLQNYGKDANELLGTGLQTKGSPFKNLKVKTKGSAAPGHQGGGWGPIGEELEEKSRRKIKFKIKRGK